MGVSYEAASAHSSTVEHAYANSSRSCLAPHFASTPLCIPPCKVLCTPRLLDHKLRLDPPPPPPAPPPPPCAGGALDAIAGDIAGESGLFFCPLKSFLPSPNLSEEESLERALAHLVAATLPGLLLR